MTTTTAQNRHEKFLQTQWNTQDYSFADAFNQIIWEQKDGYSGTTKKKIESFLNDMQKGGCQSGIIGDFVYHADCKKFYIEHINSLEDMKNEMTEQLGEEISNRQELPHYTFMCWLCFEEYCYDIYRTVYEN